MLITRKEKRDSTSIETSIRERLENTVGSIRAGDIIFLDEIYRLITLRLGALKRLGTVELAFLDEWTPVESGFYRDLARNVKEISELNLAIIPEVYTMLKEVSDDLFCAGENIINSITVCEQLLSKVEGTLKRKMSLSSVKDEILLYDSILNDDYVAEGTLAADYRGGVITLGIESYQRIWYEISEITFTKPKGKISRPKDSNNSLDFFTDGYFNTRTFSATPLFENSINLQTTAINDGRLQTSYFTEYNSRVPTQSFGISLKLAINSKKAAQFGKKRVDHVVIYLDTGDRSSVTTNETITPYLARLSINGKDKTTEILDNTIHIRGAMVGERERGFQTRSPAVYPTGSYMVCASDVEELSIDLMADIPQHIWYPEKIVLNDTGNVIHTFNYFETLILNNYDPPEAHPDPRDLYTEREINEMFAILGSGHTVYDQHTSLYRFLIGIKDIELFAYTYKTTGFIITRNLNRHEERNVAAVEVYTCEIIPEGTGIQYCISYDTVVWHQVSPITRADNNGYPTRIVYNGIDTKSTDRYINATSPSVYMKITMNGDHDLTPILKSYAVRIKLQ